MSFTPSTAEIAPTELGIEVTPPKSLANVTIRGYSVSYAETYANANDIPFEPIGQASIAASSFNGGYLALALGIVGALLVTLSKKKQEKE